MKNVSNYQYNNVSLLCSNEQVSNIRAIPSSIMIMGTSASMNMFSPATATMSGMTQYDNKNIYQSTYEKDPYANSYVDDKMSNY